MGAAPSRQNESTIRRSLLIRVAALVFVSIALFSFGLYGLIIRPTVHDLAAREMRGAVEAMQSRISQKVGQVEYVARIARAWGENGELDLDDVRAFNQRFMPMLRNSPVISSVIFADNQGREILLLQRPDGAWNNRITDVQRHGKEVRWMAWQDERILLSDERVVKDYDPRQRPWHRGALALERDDDLHWTQPYTFFTAQQPGITLSTRWRRGGETYVIAFDVLLADLSRFTGSLSVGDHGHAAVLTNDGLLLALPRHPGYSSDDQVRQALLQPAAKSPVESLRLAVEHWEQNGRGAFFATLGREQWITSVQPHRLQDQQLWLVAQAPLWDFIPGALRDVLLLAVLAVLALGLGVVMAARLARRVAVPLDILAGDSERIGALDFSPRQYRRTGWREIDRLAAAQEHMRETLQDATLRLEERVEQRTRELADAREESSRQLVLLQAIMDSMPNPVFFKDAEGHFLGCNRAYEDTFGISRDQIVGKTVRELPFLSEAEKVELQAVSEAIIRDGIMMHRKLQLPFADGQRHDTLYWANGFGREDGSPGGMVGVIVDISERKLMEEELRRARATAEEATEAKSLFLANMSHEIRTPMNAIIGMAHLAMKTELTPKQRDYVGKIHNAAISLLGIINDILDFSKIEAGKLSLENVPFSLEDVLDNVSGLLGLKANEKGLELLFNVNAGTPAGLVGDPLRLNQILTNLVSNAIKFTERGQITLTARPVDQAGDRVKLQFWIEDTGIGMSREQLLHLFQAFTQADGSTTRKYGGTGLGLSISRRLVEMMGGTIWADSTLGEGSTFCFTAWFGRAEELARPRTLPASLAGLRVLVADDNGAAREILGEALRHLDLRPDLVASGAEALAQLTEMQGGADPYRVLFLDWQMPDLDGVSTLHKLQQALPQAQWPRVVMVTAYDQEELRRQTENLGICGILVKPVSASTLFDVLVSLVDTDNAPATPLHIAAPQTRIDGMRILLAEDNEINQQIAVELLQSMGAQVTVAGDGLQAVELLERSPDDSFDLVLMDLQMPHLDGYDATERLRCQQRFAHLPILAMTAHAMPEERERCLAIGMNDHLAKPIDPTALAATLARWYEERPGASAPAPAPAKDGTDALPPIPGVNTTQGLARMAGNQALYRRLLLRFVDTQTGTGEHIRQALADGDITAAEHLAHTLKDVAGNIGAEVLQQKATALDQALRRNDGQGQKLESLRQRLAEELAAVTGAIAAALAEEGGPAPTQAAPLDADQRHRARQLLAELAEQLEASEIHAGQLFRESRALLAGLLPPADLTGLEKAIADYDYDRALNIARAHL